VARGTSVTATMCSPGGVTRHRRRRLLGGESVFARHCNVRVEAHQIGSHLRQQFRFSLSKPPLDLKVFSFGISKLFEESRSLQLALGIAEKTSFTPAQFSPQRDQSAPVVGQFDGTWHPFRRMTALLRLC
jgi:hypothetical protein